jgi:hypothetical protein
MKKYIVLLTAILCLSIITACSSSENATERSSRFGDTVDVERSMVTLDTYLNRLSGVRVRGSGRNADVRISGYEASSVDSRPLFIVDGTRVGRDFGMVYDMVNMADVENIRVLRSPRATQLYGGEGGAGAIVITMRSRD